MERGELQRIFQMFDRNGDGRVTKDELADLFGKLGISVSCQNELNEMMDKIDGNGDGCVDTEEFGTLYEWIVNREMDTEEEDLKEAFDVFDQNGDGFITGEELKSALASMGLKQGKTIEECKTMISKVEVVGNGMVDFTEFKQLISHGGLGST